MPMYKVKLKNLHNDDRQQVTVWGEDGREAGINAIRVARSLLRTQSSYEILEITDAAEIHTKIKHGKVTNMPPNGPVLTRFV